MNIVDGLQNLPAELRQQLFSILNQGPQEMDQNPYPAVGSEAFSKKVRHNKATGEFYGADGRPIANNPEENPGYKHTAWPRMIYKISDYEFETTMVDPKTTEEKVVSKRVRTKEAGLELAAGGWTPKLVTKVVKNAAELKEHEKRGWVETPAKFNALVAAWPED